MNHTHSRRVTITIPENLLQQVKQFAPKENNRSRLFQEALKHYIKYLHNEQLAKEAQKLLPEEEYALAEEGLAQLIFALVESFLIFRVKSPLAPLIKLYGVHTSPS